MGGIHSSTTSPVAIDLGSKRLKLLQLQRAGESWRVLAAAAADLPEDLPAQGPQRTAKLSELLSKLLASASFSGRRCVSALPAPAVLLRNLRLPPMPPPDLAAAVQWEASERLGLKPEQYSIQFVNAGEVRQGEESRQEVLLLAATHATIDQHMAVLTQSRLDPVGIDVCASGNAAALARLQPVSSEAPVIAVLDVGHSVSKILISRGERLLFHKQVELAGEHLNRAVQERLGLKPEEAIELRRKLASSRVSDSQEPAMFGSTQRENLERAVHDAERSAMAELAREVALCLRYFSVTFRGQRPQSVLLVGGEAGDPVLPRLFEEEASVHLIATDPLAGIDLKAAPVIAGEPGTHGQWSVAAGLCLLGARKAYEPGRAAA